jgi:uncharacterized protein YyaL (SSP411 family)
MSNRLAQTTSPYLRQHADNPVDWWPWCPQALQQAKAENKPILLSIGYSACHWCHVMAHESFADAETAELMNRLFINIKVDREERPDLDKIYQSAHQLLAQRPGGWPLTMFLTPDDQVPFFGGTYFPNAARHGLPALRDLLIRIDGAYRQQTGEIRRQNEALLQALESLTPTATDTTGALHGGPFDVARRQLAQSFDASHGGFGAAPKFPHPTHLEFLMRHWASTGNADAQALHMAIFTLRRMILGGINDQLGGGFCRYSVDAQWMIPHFEKMLYDNGPLLALCCDAWQASGETLYRDAAIATADWVIDEMQAPEGGYYASLDADSEGQEGQFYVWSFEQVKTLLEADEYRVLSAMYSVNQAANFDGKWHLHATCTSAELAHRLRLDEQTTASLLQSARGKLLRARAQRPRPGRDDKILTAWNALMIKGMARAARVLRQDRYLTSAQHALALIQAQLWQSPRLLASYQGGRAQLNAYLDDYAYLLDALLELLQARWNSDHLRFAIELADSLLKHFQDPVGGFFFTADDHERLIQRPKPLGDDAMPSGNGIAALALLRLGHLLGENRYLEAAARTLQLAWSHIQQLPYAHGALLNALDEWLNPTETLIIRAPENALAVWQEAANQGFNPRRITFLIANETAPLPPPLPAPPENGAAAAYLCRGSQCLAPVFTPQALLSLLAQTPA